MGKRYKRNETQKVKIIIALIILLLFVGIVFFVFNMFKIKTINISGSDIYTYDQLYEYIFADRNDENIILFKFTNSRNEMPTIPFIAQVDIETVGMNTLNVTVYEKAVIGYVTYKGTNMYFDKDGLVVESSTRVLEGVVEVRGLEFDSIVLYQELYVGNEKIFKTLQDVTQYLEKYKIMPNAIVIEKDEKINLLMDGVTIKLGKNDYNMTAKIYELSCMMEYFDGRKGVLDMEEYVEGKEYFIFTEEN